MRAEPADELRLTVEVDYPTLGPSGFDAVAQDWCDAAKARTFGFSKTQSRLVKHRAGSGACLRIRLCLMVKPPSIAKVYAIKMRLLGINGSIYWETCIFSAPADWSCDSFSCWSQTASSLYGSLDVVSRKKRGYRQFILSSGDYIEVRQHITGCNLFARDTGMWT